MAPKRGSEDEKMFNPRMWLPGGRHQSLADFSRCPCKGIELI
jgi:hypothetical protein